MKAMRHRAPPVAMRGDRGECAAGRMADVARLEVCGERLMPLDYERREPGSSPRVRGNLVNRTLLLLHQGAIPACAGEP